MKTELPRDLASVSMFNPFNVGDSVELDCSTGGLLWVVGKGGYGWKLHAPTNINWIHPTIHDIEGMADFIGAILEAAKT